MSVLNKHVQWDILLLGFTLESYSSHSWWCVCFFTKSPRDADEKEFTVTLYPLVRLLLGGTLG